MQGIQLVKNKKELVKNKKELKIEIEKILVNAKYQRGKYNSLNVW